MKEEKTRHDTNKLKSERLNGHEQVASDEVRRANEYVLDPCISSKCRLV